MMYLVGVLIMVVGLAVSIALHEVGHLLPAKKFGVRVSQYMVGFGPTLWSRTHGETEYGIKAIPLGGFVRIIGMYPPRQSTKPAGNSFWSRIAEDARDLSAQEIRPGEEHRAFYRLSPGKKLIIMLGGPVMNLLIAVILFTIVFAGIGLYSTTSTVGTVGECVPAHAQAECTSADPASPASLAGVQPGDELVSIAGTAITKWEDVLSAVQTFDGSAVPVVVNRDGQQLTLELTPAKLLPAPVSDGRGGAGAGQTKPAWYMGIGTAVQRVPQPLFSVPENMWQQSKAMMGTLVALPVRVYEAVEVTITGAERPESSVISIVGVGHIAGQATSLDSSRADLMDRLAMVLGLLASLNLVLFIFNLIPLPPLDGGHVLAALVEATKRGSDRLRGRKERRWLLDTARLTPVAYGVFGLLLLSGVLLMLIDIVNPVQI